MDADAVLAYLGTLDAHAVYTVASVEEDLALCGLKVMRGTDSAVVAVEGIKLALSSPEWGEPGISPQTIISAIFYLLTGTHAHASSNGRGFWFRNVLAQLHRRAEQWESRRPEAGTIWNGETCVWLDDDSTDRITMQWADWFAPLALCFAKLCVLATQRTNSDSASAVRVDGLNQELMHFAERLGVGFHVFSWDGEQCGGTVTLGTIAVSEITGAKALGLEILGDWEKSSLREWSQ
jgi:hypothetical protein